MGYLGESHEIELFCRRCNQQSNDHPFDELGIFVAANVVVTATTPSAGGVRPQLVFGINANLHSTDYSRLRPRVAPLLGSVGRSHGAPRAAPRLRRQIDR